MFIGHFAPALMAASHPKAPSLSVLLIGAQLVDWGFFTLVIAGVEKMRITPGFTVMNPLDLYYMPWTHSLLGAVVWAAGFALILRVWLKHWTPALIGGAVVLSHWFLDLLVHAPDLTLAGSPPKLGLGLWNHPWVEMPLEIGITLLGLWLYARSTGGWRTPVLGLGGLLLALQLFNWFGPEPTVVDAGTTWLALFAYALVAGIGWWVAKGEIRKNL
jgi:hypothetical protein